MPAFQALAIPPGLWAGDSYKVFNAEAVVQGQASERVALGVSAGDSLTAINAEISCSTAPTSATFDLQVAETDSDAAFQTLNSVTIVTPNKTGRIDLSGVRTRFARLKLSALTDSVGNVTASIGR